MLVLGCADQSADAVYHLALRVQILLLGLLAEKYHWRKRNEAIKILLIVFFVYCFTPFYK